MVWVVIWPYELLTMGGTIQAKIKFIFKNLLTLVMMLALSITISYWWYGSLQLIEYNFVYVMELVYAVQHYSKMVRDLRQIKFL
jgi:hypothetical protein